MRKQFLTILIMVASLITAGQTPLKMLVKQVTAASGITLISVTQTSWSTTTTPKVTASISVNNGDQIVAFGANGDNSTGDITIAGGGLTWTGRASLTAQSSFPEVWSWTTTATSTTSFAVTFTLTGTAGAWGGVVMVVRNSTGYDNSASSNVNGAAPSLSLTPVANNCAIIAVYADWNAANTTMTWRAINSLTPTSGTSYPNTTTGELFNQFVSGQYTAISAWWSNVGTAGAKTTGITAPSMKWSGVAVSLKP